MGMLMGRFIKELQVKDLASKARVDGPGQGPTRVESADCSIN